MLKISEIIKKKKCLVEYYLQYCAIISQLKNHGLALIYSTKALALIK